MRRALGFPGAGAALAKAAFVLAVAAPAFAANDIGRWTIDAGGARSTGGPYIVTGTIGQPDAGVLAGGAFAMLGGFWFGGVPNVLGVGDDPRTPAVPKVLSLSVTPNPVASSTTLRFDLPRSGKVRLAVFDAAGRQVNDVLDRECDAGTYAIAWRSAASDRALPPGLYLVRLQAGNEQRTAKMLLVH